MICNINNFLKGYWVPDESFPRFSIEQIKSLTILKETDVNATHEQHDKETNKSNSSKSGKKPPKIVQKSNKKTTKRRPHKKKIKQEKNHTSSSASTKSSELTISQEKFPKLPKKSVGKEAQVSNNARNSVNEERQDVPPKRINTKSLKYLKQRKAALDQMIKDTKTEEDYYKDRLVQPNLSVLFSNSAYSDDSLTIKTPKVKSKASACITPRTQLLNEWGENIESEIVEETQQQASAKDHDCALNVIYNCLKKAPTRKKTKSATPKRSILPRRPSRVLELPCIDAPSKMDDSTEDYFDT